MSVLLDLISQFVRKTCSGVQIGGQNWTRLPTLFQTMQIVGVVHARLEATAPWGLKSDADVAEGTTKDKRSAEAAPSPFHFAHFGMLSRGNCWLGVEGIPDPIPLA